MVHRDSVEPGNRPRPARIVFYTIGSLGDLHPALALALGLKQRGHEPVVATSETYRSRVEALGIEFRPVAPDIPDDTGAAADLTARMMDGREGSQRIFQEWIVPHLRESYQGALAAAVGADLLVSHPLTLAVRLVSERTGIPWISTMVQPLGFFSVYDPPVLGMLPGAERIQRMRPWFHRAMFGLVDRRIAPWFEPWRELRRDLGLPPSSDNPGMAGQHSPLLVLALFSPLFASKQRDWPPQTMLTGFPFFDPPGGDMLAPEVEEFLAEGPPPLLFTLGSAAVMDPGSFYEQSAAAAAALGQRAILLTGDRPENVPANLPPGVVAFPYASYTALFPRVSVIVHSGGIGTTSQALRATRPMLVVPFAHDQPDNAHRVTELGVARSIPRDRYSADGAMREIRYLLSDPEVARRVAEVGAAIAAEDGVAVACALIEDVLARVSPAPVAED